MNSNDNFLKPYKRNNSCETFIIAEAGVHHGCRIQTAKKLIDAAAEAGADAIKFQTYKSEKLVTRWAPTYWTLDNNGTKKTQYEYFKKRDRFNLYAYRLLSEYAKERNIIFCSTPFDCESVKWLENIGVPFWKVASADIDNYPLLEEIAKTGKPLILSTGASYFREIEGTVNFLRSKGVKNLALLHCNLAYPTPNSEANLRRILKLKESFPGILIGYSDHTVPDEDATIPLVAVALGAKVLEKHFTLDRRLPEDDHYHSLDPVLLRRMIKGLKAVEEATTGVREVTESEKAARRHARRSLVANGEIAKGSILTHDMMTPKRPGGGISPSLARALLGRSVNMSLRKDQQIRWECLE